MQHTMRLGPPTIREELRNPIVILMIVIFLAIISPLVLWAGYLLFG